MCKKQNRKLFLAFEKVMPNVSNWIITWKVINSRLKKKLGRKAPVFWIFFSVAFNFFCHLWCYPKKKMLFLKRPWHVFFFFFVTKNAIWMSCRHFSWWFCAAFQTIPCLTFDLMAEDFFTVIIGRLKGTRFIREGFLYCYRNY